MPAIAAIKNEREFYKDFYSLINVLKTVAIAQFHALERKMQTYEILTETLESFFGLLQLDRIDHPFANPSKNLPMGIVAITSDRGLLGGLNNRVMTAAFAHMQDAKNQLIIVGDQGKKFVHGMNLFYKGFTVGEDNERYLRALELRDYIISEVLSGRIGAVKVFYPFAESIQLHKILEIDLLPCTAWPRREKENLDEGLDDDVLLESFPGHIVEYLMYLLMAQRFFEILQFARLAEYAARTTHLEDSTGKIKDIDKKLQMQYFRARHEVIDQQMRELFSARVIYAEEDE